MADSQYDAQSRIQALLEYLHEREMDLETIADNKRMRLEQCVQLRNFEIEARQVYFQIFSNLELVIAKFPKFVEIKSFSKVFFLKIAEIDYFLKGFLKNQ